MPLTSELLCCNELVWLLWVSGSGAGAESKDPTPHLTPSLLREAAKKQAPYWGCSGIWAGTRLGLALLQQPLPLAAQMGPSQ